MQGRTQYAHTDFACKLGDVRYAVFAVLGYYLYNSASNDNAVRKARHIAGVCHLPLIQPTQYDQSGMKPL